MCLQLWPNQSHVVARMNAAGIVVGAIGIDARCHVRRAITPDQAVEAVA